MGQAGKRGGDELQRSPQRIAGVDDAVDVAADDDMSCALHRTGKASCWGEPWGSQVTEIAHVESAVRVAVGNLTLCAVQTGGEVRCMARIGLKHQEVQENFPSLVPGVNDASDASQWAMVSRAPWGRAVWSIGVRPRRLERAHGALRPRRRPRAHAARA